MWARFYWGRLEEQSRPPQGNLSCLMAPRRACRRAPALCQAQRRAWLDWLREHAGPRASLVVFLTVALGLCCSEAMAALHQDINLASPAPRVRVNCAAPCARGGKRSHPSTQALPQRRCVGASRRPLPTPRPPRFWPGPGLGWCETGEKGPPGRAGPGEAAAKASANNSSNLARKAPPGPRGHGCHPRDGPTVAEAVRAQGAVVQTAVLKQQPAPFSPPSGQTAGLKQYGRGHAASRSTTCTHGLRDKGGGRLLGGAACSPCPQGPAIGHNPLPIRPRAPARSGANCQPQCHVPPPPAAHTGGGRLLGEAAGPPRPQGHAIRHTPRPARGPTSPVATAARLAPPPSVRLRALGAPVDDLFVGGLSLLGRPVAPSMGPSGPGIRHAENHRQCSPQKARTARGRRPSRRSATPLPEPAPGGNPSHPPGPEGILVPASTICNLPPCSLFTPAASPPEGDRLAAPRSQDGPAILRRHVRLPRHRGPLLLRPGQPRLRLQGGRPHPQILRKGLAPSRQRERLPRARSPAFPWNGSCLPSSHVAPPLVVLVVGVRRHHGVGSLGWPSGQNNPLVPHQPCKPGFCPSA
jgi:hypothetical protein